MKRSKWYVRRVVLPSLLGWIVGATAPGYAAEGTTLAVIQFKTYGSGNPELIYRFDGYHWGEIEQYLPWEALFPTTFQGLLLKNGSGRDSCNAVAKIKNANFFCRTSLYLDCPLAEAVWTTRSRMAAATLPFGTVWSDVSGPVIANCPPPSPPPIEPPGCSGPYKSTKLLAVDLQTGRVTQPQWPFEAPQGLTRNEILDGKSYFQEEWALVSTAGPEQTVMLAAASDAARTQVDAYTSSLLGSQGFDADHNYLVIEAARHIGNRAEPLIRLRSLATGEPVSGPLSDGRVTFRAGFSPHGELESVETLEGSERTARILAEDLRVELPTAAAEGGHGDHRSVVFAAFEVEDGTSRFVAGVPVLPQCCCGEFHCY